MLYDSLFIFISSFYLDLNIGINGFQIILKRLKYTFTDHFIIPFLNNTKRTDFFKCRWSHVFQVILNVYSQIVDNISI